MRLAYTAPRRGGGARATRPYHPPCQDGAAAAAAAAAECRGVTGRGPRVVQRAATAPCLQQAPRAAAWPALFCGPQGRATARRES
eukprot:scaffold2910_cov390-Prasinococcus_capsulatus_cf.AAC.43